MRLYLGAAVLVLVVVGGAWAVLALTYSHSLSAGGDAYAMSAKCVRTDRALANDAQDARRYRSSGLQPLGIRWGSVRAVGLFADSLAPGAVDSADARIVSALEKQGLSQAAVSARLLHQDNLSLYYLSGTPSIAAQKAIGRCVFLVHYNRIASAVGLYISPHAELPFLPGRRRERD
ncbi:MAG TPA: hypothetical protein VLJ76_05170 [Gaiellaceae bacterium]|nr:hypothetical protein [Gaiellaceae bacterium]